VRVMQKLMVNASQTRAEKYQATDSLWSVGTAAMVDPPVDKLIGVHGTVLVLIHLNHGCINLLGSHLLAQTLAQMLDFTAVERSRAVGVHLVEQNVRDGCT